MPNSQILINLNHKTKPKTNSNPNPKSISKASSSPNPSSLFQSRSKKSQNLLINLNFQYNHSPTLQLLSALTTQILFSKNDKIFAFYY